MKEKIIEILPGSGNKKYKAIVKNKITGRERTLQFGDNRYNQYKDVTKLKLFSHKNHLDESRRTRYYLRHSGGSSKKQAINSELRKSRGIFTSKILSHMYLW